MEPSPTDAADPRQVESLGRKTVQGAAWMVGFRWLDRSFGVISMIVLARLLLPEDFGLVALASSIAAALEILRNFSFPVALIQNQSAERSHFDTAFTLNLVISLVLGLALLALAPPAARFFDEPRLASVASVFGLGFLVTGLENIGVVAFRRDMEFQKEFIYLASPRIASLLVTIPLAFWLRSYWALVFGSLAQGLIRVVTSYLMQSYRPRLALTRARELMTFSKWLFLNNSLGFLAQSLPDFVIARLAGSHALGIFSMAYEVANLPSTELAAPANRAIFPAYAKSSTDPALLRRAYLAVFGAIALITMPAAGGIAAVADRLVPLLLGANWIEAVPLIQVLAWVGFAYALYTNTAYIHIALGNPRILTWQYLLQLGVLAPGILLMVPARGALGAALALLLTAVILVPVGFAVLARTLSLRVSDFLRQIYRPAVATALMIALVGWVGSATAAAPEFAIVGLQVATGVTCYVPILVGLWLVVGRPEGGESRVLEVLASRFPALGPRR